jgi:UDP-glucose 4-epimerase
MGEEICKMYKEVYNLNVEIARFYNVYGPNEIVGGEWSALIGKWRKQVEDNEPITIVGDGEQRRDFTHVDDIVNGIYKLAMSNEKHNNGWEFGSGFDYSINEISDIFVNKFNCEKIFIPNQKGNYRKSLRKNDDAINRLGWVTKDRLKKYIQNL